MRPIGVFDTNVLFSAIGWKGKPWKCLELARAGMVEGLTCQEILEELAEKLETKLSFPPEKWVATIADFMTFLRLVSIPGTLRAVPADPDDDKVLLPIGVFKGIAIVTPADFLAIVAQP